MSATASEINSKSEQTTILDNKNNNNGDAADFHEDGNPATYPKDIRFWMIIVSLLVATFLSALDLTGIQKFPRL